MRTPNRRRHVAAAREQFLSSGSVARTAVGETILTSWQRSRIAGVDIDEPLVPFDEAIDLRSRLARCAQPVMSRLQDQLDDIPVSVVLTDAQGRLIDRKDSERKLARIFDTVYFAPGFCYAEAHVGTNGVGTALEAGRAVFVCGPEHFNERSMPFACAGAPIRNPLTRRIEGLIDLSCLAEDAHPMMRALVHEAALDIERLLLEDGSERQRLVLEEFLAACGRSGSAVLSVSGDVVMANRRASSLLTPADEELLRLAAADAHQLAPGTVIEMSLGAGRWAKVRCHPVSQAGEPAGAVFEVHLAEARQERQPGRSPMGLPGLVGRSAQWRDTCAQVRAAARGRAPLLVFGEPGVGKLALVRSAHRELTPAGGLDVVDCAAGPLPAVDDLARADPTSSATVVFRHLDRLDPTETDDMARLLDRLTHAAPGTWVVGTVGSRIEERLLDRFTTSVTVPPLRHRIDDLAGLVASLLRRLAPARDVTCAPDAMRVLERNAWPGNLTELEQVLRAALARRPAGLLRDEDLPPTCFTTSRRVLTPIEALERDAIIRALNDAGGNRKKAAADLGMSRSSLYRKIHTFGIT